MTAVTALENIQNIFCNVYPKENLMQQSLHQSSVVMLKRPKFYAMISILVLVVLAFIASFGVYYTQYTNLMKIYQRQYSQLQHYQKSECSSDDPNPTYAITMRYHPIGDTQQLSSAQNDVPTGAERQRGLLGGEDYQATYHQKIYQIKTLPAKRAQLDVLKYNLTHHHIEKLSSGTIKDDDIDNVLLFRSDGSINIITYDEYLVEEELIKNLSDEELGFEKPDTRDVQLQRHNLLGVLEDRTSLYVSGNILGNVQANALMGDVVLQDGLVGNVQAKSIMGDVVLQDALVGNVQASSLMGNIQATSLEGNITVSDTLEGDVQANTLTGNVRANSLEGNITLDNALIGNVQANAIVGNITLTDSLVGDVQANALIGNVQTNSLTGNIGISKELTGHFQAGKIVAKQHDQPAIAVDGDIFANHQAISVQGLVKSDNEAGVSLLAGIESLKDGVSVQGSITSNGNGISVQGSIVSTNGNGILVIKTDDAQPNVIQGGVGTRSTDQGYPGVNNYAAVNITGNIHSGSDTIVITGDVKSKWYSGIHIKGDVQVENEQLRSDAYGIHIEGNVLGYNGGINVSKQIRSIRGQAAIMVGKGFKAISGNSSYSHAIQGHDNGVMVQNGIKTNTGAGIYTNGNIDATGANGYGIHVESGSITSKNSAFAIDQGNLVSTGSMATIQVDGDVISMQEVGIHVGRTVQSKLDGIVVSGVENDGIRSAISSEEGYALNISGNIDAAGGLLVQNGNITANGELPDSEEEPYAGVRMKCVQDPETNECAVGGYIVTKDAFGVWLEGGVQTKIVGGKGESIRLGDVEYLKDPSSEASLGTAIEIGNVESHGSGVSIGDVLTQDGSGISAQHVVSNEGHAITALTATSEYASVNTGQSGSEHPSVIQVRHVETTSPKVDGIRVSKVSTNTGTAIHVYETDATDQPTEPGTISSEGIGIKVGDKKENGMYRINTVDIAISVQGNVESTEKSAVSLNGNVDSQNAAISVSGKITSRGNGVAVTNGIESNGIGLTITNGSIYSRMDAIRVKQPDATQPAIYSVSGEHPTINITGNVQSDKNSAILINGGVITHAKDDDTSSSMYDDYYAFKADYIDASQYGSSPIKSGPYGVHVEWIKSYNDSIHISGADTDGNALLSNASTIKVVNGNLVGSRRGIVLTKAQNETLQEASSSGDTDLTNAKKELVGNLSTSAVVDLGGNISLIGFDTQVTVHFPNDTSNDNLHESYNNSFSPIHMLRVGGNITGGTNSNTSSNGIWVDGSIKVSGSTANNLIDTQGNAININGNVSGVIGVHIVENVINSSHGFMVNGVMKNIANNAIRINNINNEEYAIDTQNGLWLDNGGIKYSNKALRSGKIVPKSLSSGGQAITINGDISGPQGAIGITGNVKQTSNSWNNSALRISGNIQSSNYNGIQVEGNIIGAKSGILVTGNIISNASKWNCYTQCQSGHDSEPCQTCISDMFNSNSNKANVYDDIPAAINVAGIQGQRLAYGIHVWENISTVNDSIKINNYKNGALAINSSQGSNIIINGSMLANQSGIKVNGSLNSTGYNDTIHINGSVYNDFFIENIIRCRDDQGNITYTDESTAEIDHISAVYIKDIQTKLGENNTEIKPVQDDQHEGTCYSGFMRGAEGLIVSTIKSFNNSFTIQESIHSDMYRGIQIDPKAHVFGKDAAIYSTCSTLESDDSVIHVEHASVITNNPDRSAIEFIQLYANNEFHFSRIDLDEWNDVCPA